MPHRVDHKAMLLADLVPSLAQNDWARHSPVSALALDSREVEPGADDQPDPHLLRRRVGADDAGQAVAVGDRHRVQAEGGGRLDVRSHEAIVFEARHHLAKPFSSGRMPKSSLRSFQR